MADVIVFINNRYANECYDREVLTDIVENAVEHFTFKVVEKELTENNELDYLEVLWVVEENIKKRERLKASISIEINEGEELWQNSLHKIFADGLMEIVEKEVTYVKGSNKRNFYSKNPNPMREVTEVITLACYEGKCYKLSEFVKKDEFVNNSNNRWVPQVYCSI